MKTKEFNTQQKKLIDDIVDIKHRQEAIELMAGAAVREARSMTIDELTAIRDHLTETDFEETYCDIIDDLYATLLAT